jgi:AraC-like DNA-binding protein
MSTPETPAKINRVWRDPTGAVHGTDRTGISASFMRVDEPGTHDMARAQADDARHTISTMLSDFHCVTTHDGALASEGRHAFGMATLVQMGRRPRSLLTGRHQILHFHVPHRFLTELVQQAHLGNPGELELVDPALAMDPVITGLGQAALSEMRDQQTLSRLRIDALGQDLAIHLLRRWSNLVGTPRVAREAARGGLAPWQVKRATDYMEEHLADDFRLEDLSRLLDLSTFHLCRAFKQSTGLPPHRWRLARRIERARELLEGTNRSVTDIAAAVGYDDPSQLAAVFRKALGVTPTGYRRQRQS